MELPSQGGSRIPKLDAFRKNAPKLFQLFSLNKIKKTTLHSFGDNINKGGDLGKLDILILKCTDFFPNYGHKLASLKALDNLTPQVKNLWSLYCHRNCISFIFIEESITNLWITIELTLYFRSCYVCKKGRRRFFLYSWW